MAADAGQHSTFHGIGVSAGTAVGPLVVVTPAPTAPADEAPTTDAAAASATVHGVLDDVAAGLEARAASASDHARPILEAGAMMARDPGLAMGIDTQLQAGKGIGDIQGDDQAVICFGHAQSFRRPTGFAMGATTSQVGEPGGGGSRRPTPLPVHGSNREGEFCGAQHPHRSGPPRTEGAWHSAKRAFAAAAMRRDLCQLRQWVCRQQHGGLLPAPGGQRQGLDFTGFGRGHAASSVKVKTGVSRIAFRFGFPALDSSRILEKRRGDCQLRCKTRKVSRRRCGRPESGG